MCKYCPHNGWREAHLARSARSGDRCAKAEATSPCVGHLTFCECACTVYAQQEGVARGYRNSEEQEHVTVVLEGICDTVYSIRCLKLSLAALVMCKAGLRARKPRVPGPPKPGPMLRLIGSEGSAPNGESPSPACKPGLSILGRSGIYSG